MIRIFQIAAIILIALTGSALADSVRVQDPAKFCDDLFANISPFKSSEIATKIAAAIGKPDATDTLETAMKTINDKKIDFSKKVVDKDIAGALRQIVYYTFVQDIGFLYFRFNFKMSQTGWILANFNFKSETNELFPKDFVQP